MKWNHNIFINNIKTLIDTHCHGNAKEFNDIIDSRDAATRWKKPGYRPSLDILLTVTEKFDVSMNWLLTGTEPMASNTHGVAEPPAQYCSEEEFMSQWPEEIRQACRQLKKILLSDHPVIKPALISNLAAFQYSVEKEKSQDEEISRLSRRLKFLEDYHKAERRTGIDEAASLNTGKRKT